VVIAIALTPLLYLGRGVFTRYLEDEGGDPIQPLAARPSDT
jgi:hypothetical protein